MSASKASNHQLLNTKQESSIEYDSVLNRSHYLCPEPVDLKRSMSAMQNTMSTGLTSEHKILDGDDGRRLKISFVSSIHGANPFWMRERTVLMYSDGHALIILAVAEMNLTIVAGGKYSIEA